MPRFLTEDFLNEDSLQRYRREYDEQQEEFARQRRQEERRQRTQVTTSPDDYWNEVDARIDAKLGRVIEALEAFSEACVGQLENLQAKLAGQDREIQQLNKRFEVEISLARKLSKVQREFDQARQQQPNFRSELDALKVTIEQQEKTIVRLRSRATQLEFAQKQSDAARWKDRREMSVTEMRVTKFGQQTEKILRELYENGFDVVEEMQSPSRLA
jgi:chromosome segregation ATPase